MKTIFVSVLSACIGVWLTLEYLAHEQLVKEISERPAQHDILLQEIPGYEISNANQGIHLPEEDFVDASASSTSSVVFIKNLSVYKYRTGHWLDWFYQPRASQRVSTGSGVILSEDGYIITNNHVIDEAQEIEVVHQKRTYAAKLIGTDPSTDLAVIKIEGLDLPAITIGNSAEVKVGEWVLAVGNPFNLTSTVTAGIVSAKGRNINILREKFPIESFIQTDAAINPGNSGGALVNRDGQLIGINTAILSQTGSYAGYGFAVPSDIVRKVFTDIVKYGEVQKAFIGAEYLDLDSEIAADLGINGLNGVIVTQVQQGWAADKSGIKEGDVIIGVNGQNIAGKSDLEELIGYKYPGDLMQVKIKRGDKMLTKGIELTNSEGTSGVLIRAVYQSQSLGASFEKVSKAERDLIGIDAGVRVVEVGNGFFRKMDIPKGFIITEINRRPIETPEELEEILERIEGRVYVSGITKEGRKGVLPYIF